MYRRSSLRKSKMFQPQGYASSALMLQSQPAMRTSLTVDFPTSPDSQNLFGEEMHHFMHSQHPLVLINLPEMFSCSGCKEHGAGKRFLCQKCDFQLHDFCAQSPPFLKAHPLHAQHQLVFHSKPKTGGILWPRCNICGKSTKGFTFKCSACSFQMHPCCAMLSNEMTLSSHPQHMLKLMPSSATADDIQYYSGPVCSECRQIKRSGRLYGCTECDNYHIHAVCTKNLINGLKANGIKDPQKTTSVLGPAVRLASQAVIEFIGALIEGIGEGVGEVLIQNMVKGRCNSSKRRLE